MKFIIAGVASLAFAGSVLAAVPSMSVEKKPARKQPTRSNCQPSRSCGFTSEDNSSGQNREDHVQQVNEKGHLRPPCGSVFVFLRST